MTHPFHPLAGGEFVFVDVRQTWRQDRVFFLDDCGVQLSLPREWTDLADVDFFVRVAAGRSAFRIDDLVDLAALISSSDVEPTDTATDL